MGTGSAQKKETQGTRGNTRGHQGTQGTQQRNEPQAAKHKQTKNKPWPTTSKPRANHKPRSTPKWHQSPPKMLPKASQNALPDGVLDKIEFSAANSPHFGPQGSPKGSQMTPKSHQKGEKRDTEKHIKKHMEKHHQKAAKREPKSTIWETFLDPKGPQSPKGASSRNTSNPCIKRTLS